MTAPPCTLPPKFTSPGSARNRSVISRVALAGAGMGVRSAGAGRNHHGTSKMGMERHGKSVGGDPRGPEHGRVEELHAGLVEPGESGVIEEDHHAPRGGEILAVHRRALLASEER